MATAQREQEEVDIGEYARMALQKTQHNASAATKLLESWAQNDPNLKDALITPLIRGACYDAIRAVFRVDRKRIWTTVDHSTDSPGSSSRRVEHLASSNLMMFPLPGGKRLKDATREDLLFASDFYTKQGRDMLTKARWLTLVSQHMTGKKRVSDVMDEKKLIDLKDKSVEGQ